MEMTKTTKSCASKKNLGQFYTTNYDLIFQEMNLDIFTPSISHFIEPFVGKGHLIEYIQTNKQENTFTIECFDIDPKYEKGFVEKRDTLLEPPSYQNKIVVTNPPYLAKNKCKNKVYFEKYNVNDLYKCFMQSIILDPPNGGLIIIPLNFWCSIREMDVQLRKRFLSKFMVKRVNVFEQSVFNDTSYTVCSILFQIRQLDDKKDYPIRMFFYPNMKSFEFLLDSSNNYIIGGEIYKLPICPKFKIYRVLEGQKSNSNILLKALDDDGKKRINLCLSDKTYFGKITSRTYASINIDPPIPVPKQIEVVEQFNFLIEEFREKYHSMFLTNYRESKDISRKRISFDLVYQIIGYLLR